MQVYRNWSGLRHDGRVIAGVGNFDGLHPGHLGVLEQVRRQADQQQVLAAAVLFEPHADEYLRPPPAPPRLMRLRDKLHGLQNAAMDLVLCLRFGQSLANLGAQDFVQQVLVEGLRVRGLVIGRDFHFGSGREGDANLLRTLGTQADFSVHCIADICHQGQRISSTAIRAALTQGQLQQARQLLGRPYSLRGRVVHGDGRGRQLGFATANLSFGRHRSPLRGVYITGTRLAGNYHPSVSYLGCRPVFGGTVPVLETHLLNHQEDLYGQRIEVEFLQQLRAETHLEDVAALQQQMQMDINAARQYHHRTAHG